MVTAPSVLVARFRWPEGDWLDALRPLAAGDGELRAFRAIQTDEGRAYIALSAREPRARQIEEAVRGALADATLSRLALLMEIPGASAGESAPYHYVVETDVLPEHEADFNAWYDREHLAGLASVPGTVRAMRFRNVDGRPRYHACYDLTRPDTLGSPPWLAVRGTPWSDRVRPGFFNTTRTMFRRT